MQRREQPHLAPAVSLPVPAAAAAGGASSSGSGRGAAHSCRRWVGQHGLKARSCLPAAVLLCGTACWSAQLLSRAWVGAPRAGDADRPLTGLHSVAAGHQVSAGPDPPEAGRRELLAGAGVFASGALWASSPEDADAFRIDRILNAKKSYLPKIRSYYQKLEGLRDDIYLMAQLPDGSRLKIASRPSDWNRGIDRQLVGDLTVIAGENFNENKEGCAEFESMAKGAIILIARGKCTFEQKLKNAVAAGAKAAIIYDEKVSKQPLEKQGKTGSTRSKSVATRSAGDALAGGIALLPIEQGITVMAVSPGTTPPIDGVMINRANGTAIVDGIREGGKARIIGVDRFEFKDGIDRFIKKDLKKLVSEMEIYGNTLRISKDDMGDPIIKVLKKSREEFAEAVRSKDYGAIQRAWAKWQQDLTDEGRFEITEMM